MAGFAFGDKLFSVHLYGTSSFAGSMWFIPFFSTYGLSFSPLEVGYRTTRVFDSGWMEYFDGRFPQNLGDLSEEQGERFHQDIKTMEARYQGRWDAHMMVDYCWNLMRDCPCRSHSRKSYKRSFLCVEWLESLYH